jgi:hypothetical protein
MREGHRRINTTASECDRQCPVACQDNRLDETTHLRPQFVSRPIARPTRSHISRGDRRAVGKTRVLAQRDDPRSAIRIEMPRRSQTWRDTSHAVDSHQRLEELTEEQTLAVVRRAWCIRWIDGLAQAHGRNRFTRSRDQRALVQRLRRPAPSAVEGSICLRRIRETGGRCPRDARACHRLKADHEHERANHLPRRHVFRS